MLADGSTYVACRDLTQSEPHVLEELAPVALALDVARRVEVTEVVAEGELHVHVQHEAVGQEEGVVGDLAGACQLLVTPVVDAVDEPREAQHVVGHALAPLATCRRADERFPERLRGLGEGARRTAGFGQLTGQRARLLAPVTFDPLDQVGERVELAAHLVELAVDQGAGAVELRRAESPLSGEHLLVHAHEMVDRGLHRGAVGARHAPPTTAADHERDDEGRHQRRDHHETQYDQHSVHAPDGTQGV